MLCAYLCSAKPLNVLPYTKSYCANDTVKYTTKNINQLGFFKGVLWVDVELPKELIISNGYLKIDFPFIDSCIVKSNGHMLYKLGDAYKFNNRPIAHKTFILPITKLMAINGIQFTIYGNGEYTRFPIQYGTLDELTNDNTTNLFLGAYNGVIVFAVFLSIFLFFSLRERIYVWYLLFLFATFVFQFSTEGLTFQYLWPNYPWWANHVIPFSGALALFMLVAFTRQLFKNSETKKLRIIYSSAQFALVIFVFFALLPNPYYSISLVGASVASIFINLFLLKIGIYYVIKKHPQAYYYTTAFSMLIIAIILSQLTYNGVLPLNFLTNNILLVGSGVQIVLLSLGLSRTITEFKRAEELAQKALLAQLKKQTEDQQKANELLELKVQERTLELAELNNEHTQSVTYASYIQASLLPSLSLIKERLKDSFILYNPRDIVSGDFYWYCDVQTSAVPSINLQVLCAVDCTGHGVPGAFMSLVANNLINLTIKDDDVNTPADVIAFVNKNLAKAMNKKDEIQVINDGMDMAVSAYEPITKTLYYAGANRPLYIVKHNTQELIEIKATKVSVGGHTPITQTWENITIPLNTGDCFYLSSDGYADQFGGEKNKKMTTKRLKEFLIQIHALTMEEQKQALQNYFTSWQGNEQQVDDVMLIGVRV